MIKIGKLILLAALFVTLTTSCYEKLEMPWPQKVWDEESLKIKFGADTKFMSIADFKDLFYNEYGKGSSSVGMHYDIDENIIIHGKVISCDRSGNVYKSIYIYDEDCQQAIEVKVMVSNYVYFQRGQTVYVQTKGLCIGSYRYNLSVGARPTEKDISKGYANRNLDNSMLTDQHIFEGAAGQINEEDILVVNASDYADKLGADKSGYDILYDEKNLGRLIRFEGLTYKEGEMQSGSRSDTLPNYLETTNPEGSTETEYTNKYYDIEGVPSTYAYSYDNKRYYGSALFTFDPSSDNMNDMGHFIVRVSGYANFALKRLPENNSTGTITAILNRYSGKDGRYIKHQLLVNDFEDIEFEPAADKAPESEEETAPEA